VVTEGESAFGVRLARVGRETVTLEVAGQPIELRLTPAPPVARAALHPPEPPATGLPPEDPATPAREMDRRQVQMRIADEMTRILAETAIAPVMEEGRVIGVQLTRLPEGSLLSDAGLRQGDVLTRINDTEIDGMASLIGLWPRLQNATELRAVVLRGGQPTSLRVSLR
jgi:type II secretory pathway component PulC